MTGTSVEELQSLQQELLGSTGEQPEASEAASLSAGDVARGAVRNIVPSAVQVARDFIYPFIHPIETANALYRIGRGGVELAIPGEQLFEENAEAVGQFFAERYGGWENVKRTMASDPVGFIADVSVVLSAGGTAAARAPGAVGTAARAAQRAGRVVDPTRLPINLARAGAPVVGLTTGAGAEAVRIAGESGQTGGRVGRAFRQSMRGNISSKEIVASAQNATFELRRRKGAAYQAGMERIAKDTAVLDFGKVDTVAKEASAIKTFKRVELTRSTKNMSEQINSVLDEWRELDPTEFHTAEGFDALKQSIGDLADTAEIGSPSHKMATDVVRGIKEQIVEQAPEYASVMGAYAEAADLIKEIERTLSLNATATVDTQIRKLMSVLRNNATTNYGRRLALAEMLQSVGADNLMEMLAGQMLTDVVPRGLQRAVAGAVAVGGAVALEPSAIPALAIQSPRLVGEAAQAAGRVSGVVPRGSGQALLQSGRQARTDERQAPRAR